MRRHLPCPAQRPGAQQASSAEVLAVGASSVFAGTYQALATGSAGGAPSPIGPSMARAGGDGLLAINTVVRRLRIATPLGREPCVAVATSDLPLLARGVLDEAVESTRFEDPA